MFFGLGSDGTVGANKNSVKIIGENTDLLRPGLLRLRLQEVGLGDRLAPAIRPRADPLHLPHQKAPISSPATSSVFLEKMEVLELAGPGATFLLNSPYGPDEVWDQLPAEVQQQIVDKGLEFWVIDAIAWRREGGDGRAHQHRHAALLLRISRASCPRTRRSRRSRADREDLRQARRRRWSSATTPPSTRSLAELSEVESRPRPPATDGAAAGPRRCPRFRASG